MGAVRAANERARWAEMAVEISSRLHEKILVSTATTQPDTLMRFTSPVLTRVMGSPVTIAALLAGSPVTNGVLSPSFRRITRPRGPVARRQTRGTTPTAPSLIDRMNRGEFNPAPPPPTPSGVSTIGRYKGDLVPSWLTPGLLNFLKRLPFLLILLAIILLIVAVILFFAVGACSWSDRSGYWRGGSSGKLRRPALGTKPGGAGGTRRRHHHRRHDQDSHRSCEFCSVTLCSRCRPGR